MTKALEVYEAVIAELGVVTIEISQCSDAGMCGNYHPVVTIVYPPVNRLADAKVLLAKLIDLYGFVYGAHFEVMTKEELKEFNDGPL